jgi:hypothetical protein
MSEVQPPSGANQITRVVQARRPCVEIAELLAAAIVRMQQRDSLNIHATDSEVSLGFSANQRVNSNPS